MSQDHLSTRLRNFEQCVETASGQSTYFGLCIEQMSTEELLAVIGHMALKAERDKTRQADYVHRSASRGGTGPLYLPAPGSGA